MPNLLESPRWEDGIYQLEVYDPVEGGPDGIDNLQAKQLANRTAYLKQQVEALLAELNDAEAQLSATGDALAGHVVAGDPHPQYLTQPEGDNRYAGGAHTHPVATQAADGLMSLADKTKLDGVANGAAALGNTAGTALAASGSAGNSPTAARSNHVHPFPTPDDIGAVAATEKGAVNGVATLGGDGKLNSNQLPALAISDTFVVSTQAAMLALTAEPGDICVRTDENKSYILKASPASTLANWQQLLFPAGGGGTVTSVAIAVPTGLSVSGSPLTGSGTITISLAAGYSIPTTAKQGQWDTAYGWGNHAVAGYHVVGGALGTPSSGNLSNCTADGTNLVGYRGIPQISPGAAYTCTLADAGKHVYQSGNGTVTIPANAAVAFAIGDAITIVSGASQISIAINTDTMRLAGTGTTGTRTLSAYGMATAVKIAATEWRISGSGLS